MARVRFLDQVPVSAYTIEGGTVATTASYAINALSASYASGSTSSSYALTASYVAGLNLSQISTGSITASVNVDPNSLFLIKSGSIPYINISSSGNTDVYSNLFIVRNFTTKQPILTVSQSIIQIATQSLAPTGATVAGTIWFTSSSFYVGLE